MNLNSGHIIFFILLAVLLKGELLLAQTSKSPTQSQNGLLIFERHENGYDLYFIKTLDDDIKKLATVRDTVVAISLGAPGCDASNIGSYKYYLNQHIAFDSLFIPIKQEIQTRKEYTDDFFIYTKQGRIVYHKSKGYNLQKRFKTLYIDNKPLVLKIDDFIPFDEFFPKEEIKKVKR